MTSASPIGPNLVLDKNYGSYFLPSFDEAMKSGYIKHDGILLTPLSESLAMRAGVLPGDRVKSIDGVLMSDIEMLKATISKGKPMTLIVSGTGGDRTLSITPEGGKIGSYLTYKNIDIDKTYSESFTFGQSLI